MCVFRRFCGFSELCVQSCVLRTLQLKFVSAFLFGRFPWPHMTEPWLRAASCVWDDKVEAAGSRCGAAKYITRKHGNKNKGVVSQATITQDSLRDRNDSYLLAISQEVRVVPVSNETSHDQHLSILSHNLCSHVFLGQHVAPCTSECAVSFEALVAFGTMVACLGACGGAAGIPLARRMLESWL